MSHPISRSLYMSFSFFFNSTAPTEIYTLSLHDALPISINHAEGLRGRLLLVHGSGDDNVHYQGSERLLNRLIALGKPVDFMEYPNRSHCICEGRGTTLHVFSLLTRYLLEHLPAGPRTRDGRGV